MAKAPQFNGTAAVSGAVAMLFTFLSILPVLKSWLISPVLGAMGSTNLLQGNVFDIQPQIRVSSNAGPVNGLILTFQLFPDASARFERLALSDCQSHSFPLGDSAEVSVFF